jgi:hypothetical protein
MRIIGMTLVVGCGGGTKIKQAPSPIVGPTEEYVNQPEPEPEPEMINLYDLIDVRQYYSFNLRLGSAKRGFRDFQKRGRLPGGKEFTWHYWGALMAKDGLPESNLPMEFALEWGREVIPD